MREKRKRDNYWIIFLILACMFFWAAWLARTVDGRWHEALSIWGFTFSGICVLAIIIEMLWDVFHDN